MRPKRGLRARRGRPLTLTPITRPPPRPVGRLASIERRLAHGSGSPGPDGRIVAGTMSRVTAYLIDTLLLGALTLAGWELVGRSLGLGVGMDAGQALDADPVRATVARLAVSGSISVVYFVALWTGGRRTLGMRLFWLCVVWVPDGAPIGFRAALIRWAALEGPAFLGTIAVLAGLGQPVLLSLAAQAWPLVLLASVVTSGSRRGLHDRAARTAVVLG